MLKTVWTVMYKLQWYEKGVNRGVWARRWGGRGKEITRLCGLIAGWLVVKIGQLRIKLMI